MKVREIHLCVIYLIYIFLFKINYIFFWQIKINYILIMFLFFINKHAYHHGVVGF